MSASLRTFGPVALILTLASLSAMHVHVFGIGLNYDVDCAQYLIGAVTFALALIVRLPKSKLISAGVICLMPLLCAVSFSWAELVSELGPQSSAGWGVVWFIYSYITSVGALIPALLIKWLIRKNRFAVC